MPRINAGRSPLPPGRSQLRPGEGTWADATPEPRSSARVLYGHGQALTTLQTWLPCQISSPLTTHTHTLTVRTCRSERARESDTPNTRSKKKNLSSQHCSAYSSVGGAAAPNPPGEHSRPGTAPPVGGGAGAPPKNPPSRASRGLPPPNPARKPFANLLNPSSFYFPATHHRRRPYQP